ncbi:MAG: dTMP kinase [Parvularculaceae bacterium]
MTGAAPNERRGPFITFEGGDGVGKSTQIARLAVRLRAAGREVVVTREPGGSPGAEAIRALLVQGAADRWSARTEALLMFAARADHLERTINPARARGAVVLCDRFADSSMAYQGIAGALGREAVATLGALIVGADGPTLTFVLDASSQEGLNAQARAATATTASKRKAPNTRNACGKPFLRSPKARLNAASSSTRRATSIRSLKKSRASRSKGWARHERASGAPRTRIRYRPHRGRSACARALQAARFRMAGSSPARKAGKATLAYRLARALLEPEALSEPARFRFRKRRASSASSPVGRTLTFSSPNASMMKRMSAMRLKFLLKRSASSTPF